MRDKNEVGYVLYVNSMLASVCFVDLFDRVGFYRIDKLTEHLKASERMQILVGKC